MCLRKVEAKKRIILFGKLVRQVSYEYQTPIQIKECQSKEKNYSIIFGNLSELSDTYHMNIIQVSDTNTCWISQHI
jgi:hypothetical protein